MSRQQDIQIAEILGWDLRGHVPQDNPDSWEGLMLVKDDTHEIMYPHSCPAFTSDPAADYQVLEWVRDNLVHGMEGRPLKNFITYLLDEWTGREKHRRMSGDTESDPMLFAHYKPGDYSRALLALKEKGIL